MVWLISVLFRPVYANNANVHYVFDHDVIGERCIRAEPGFGGGKIESPKKIP